MGVPVRVKAKAVQQFLIIIGAHRLDLVWFGGVRKQGGGAMQELGAAGEQLRLDPTTVIPASPHCCSARPRPTDWCRQCKETKTKQPRPRFLFLLQHDTGVRGTASNATI